MYFLKKTAYNKKNPRFFHNQNAHFRNAEKLKKPEDYLF